MTHRNNRDDKGAALILVLIVVTVIAVGASVLLSLADTSIRTTVNLRDQAAATYNADGAMRAAINGIRDSSYNASAGQHCFGGTDTLSLPGFYGADSAAVSCTADPSKVLIQCPSLSHCNRPGSAILTLGRIIGEDGLNIKQPTGSTFMVHGIVFSNSNINVVNGSLNTNAKAYARGACSGTIQSTPAASCNYGTTANPLGDDPGYSPATPTVPAYRPLPACTTPDSVVVFQPGYYDDASGLSAMMAGNSACRHSTWWFKPGTYYFDFHNAGSNPNPLLNSGSNVWTLDDGYLVAGTPVNAAGVAIAAPPVPAAIPGSCDNPIDNAKAVGVQFIFGGDSQFAIKSGQAEICGTYSASKPPVAIYGLTSGSETTTQLTGANALKLNAVTTPGQFGASATTTNLVDVDGTRFATWKSGKKNDSGSVTVSGYAAPLAIPAGSILKSAAVTVTHRHSDTGSSDGLAVTLTPNGGSPTSGSATGHIGATAFQTDSVALDTAGTGPLAQAVHDGTFTGARIALTTNLVAKDDTEDVDAVQLNMTYVAPAFRAGTGCVSTGPYTGTGGSSCALITSLNNAGNQFYVQGTTYVPNAVVDLTLNNATEQVFRFGVIARALWIKETGSFSYGGVVIEVPDDSPGFVFSVYLNVYVCLRSSTCTPGGSASLRAKVAFIDTDPTTPTPGQRQVAVLSWSRLG
jgi:Tfp pilus assembly protein PilV